MQWLWANDADLPLCIAKARACRAASSCMTEGRKEAALRPCLRRRREERTSHGKLWRRQPASPVHACAAAVVRSCYAYCARCKVSSTHGGHVRAGTALCRLATSAVWLRLLAVALNVSTVVGLQECPDSRAHASGRKASCASAAPVHASARCTLL